jgi:hypothetical protein
MRTSRIIAGFALITLLITLVVVAKNSISWRARTIEKVGIFNSESEVAYQDGLNLSHAVPLATVLKNEDIDVLWDKYGKDYWACYVRTSQGKRGWVLCTSLVKVSQ